MFRVQGLGFRVKGLGLGFRLQDELFDSQPRAFTRMCTNSWPPNPETPRGQT